MKKHSFKTSQDLGMNTEAKIGRRSVLAALGSAALLPNFAHAQTAEWKPSRPIRLMNGFSAGGSADILCRILGESMRPTLGQQVIVETKAGANGFIAAETAVRSPPDGLTIGFVTMSMLAVSPQLAGVKIPFNTQTDITPVSSIAGIYQLMVAAPEAPFKTIPELIAYAKAHPGELTYASAGIGSAPHLAGELFKRQAGIEMSHVPYKGGSQAIVDVQANRVSMLIGNMPDFIGQVKGGTLRPIAFGGDRAAPALPDLPLIKTWLPDFNASNWFGIIAPAGLPPPILTALSNALQAAMADPEVRKKMVELGAEALPGSPAQFQRLIDADRKRWGDVIKAAAIRAE